MGVTSGPALARPALWLAQQGAGAAPTRPDGAISADGQLLGTWPSTAFDAPAALSALLARAGLDAQALEGWRGRSRRPPRGRLDRLADAIEAHVDLAALFAPDRI